MPIDDMSLEELKQFSPVFEEDVYDAISMETCVNKRLTIGAPGEEAMKKVIAIEEAYLEKNETKGAHRMQNRLSRCDVRNCGTSLIYCLKYRLVGISDCASPTYI